MKNFITMILSITTPFFALVLILNSVAKILANFCLILFTTSVDEPEEAKSNQFEKCGGQNTSQCN
jgi:hypothetical protein